MKKIWMLVALVSIASLADVSLAAQPRTKKTTTKKTEPLKGTVIVKSPQASLLSKPQARATRIEALGKFTPVRVIANAGGYTQVETLAGKKGYVESRHLAENCFVSVAGRKSVNVRSGPKANDTILFTLQSTYPLAVIDKKGRRVKVTDYEGDSGWIHEGLLSTKSYVIVNLKSINLRSEPGLDSSGKPIGKMLFTAPKGVVFEVIGVDKKSGWLHLRHADGDDAWCSAKIVWGWLNQ